MLQLEGDTGHPFSISLRHALFREVLLDEIGPVDRMRLHAAVARVLDDGRRTGRDVDPSELAQHYLSAGELGDRRRALESATAAAEQAERALAFGEAARLLRAALAAMDGLDVDAGDRHDLLLRLGDIERRGGAIAEAQDTLSPCDPPR